MWTVAIIASIYLVGMGAYIEAALRTEHEPGIDAFFWPVIVLIMIGIIIVNIFKPNK
jgi:hypothetical protein